MINKLVDYIKASIEELKKVVWPTRKVATRLTLLVIGSAVVLALYLGGLDAMFRNLLQTIITRIN